MSAQLVLRDDEMEALVACARMVQADDNVLPEHQVAVRTAVDKLARELARPSRRRRK